MSTASPAVDRTVPDEGRHDNDILFERAPPNGLEQQLGLLKHDRLDIKRRAVLLALVGWLPLVVLAGLQSLALGTGDATSMLWQIGIHARYLVAVPLLVVAEAACAPQLNHLIRNFVESGVVDERERRGFDAAVASTRELLRSRRAEWVVIALAYLVVLETVLSRSHGDLPEWALSSGITPLFSFAGWWHMLVSLPLLLVLILGWFWRLVLWARLLWLISRLKLHLVVSHPDHCAGLSFLGHSVRAFAIVALAFSSIAAGRSAYLVLTGAGLPTQNFYFNIGLMVAVMALFVAPLLVFTPTLMLAWRRGTLAYDALAERVGHVFERKWLAAKPDDGTLERPDFSATTDLYQVVANVHAIRFVPFDLKDLIPLAVAVLLPFVPVVLLAFPLEQIWKQAKSLLL